MSRLIGLNKFARRGRLLLPLGTAENTPRVPPPASGSTATEFDLVTGAATNPFPDDALYEGGTKRNAFPTAEGFGANTKGARAPGTPITVYYVTNLNDSGPGSLRDALMATGPRIVVILVSGWIRLQSNIDMVDGNLTVYGNWVKSGFKGSAIRMYNSSSSGGSLILADSIGEIIYRYLRGYRAPHPDFIASGADESAGNAFSLVDNDNTLPNNFIFDHINCAFTTDNHCSIRTDDITIQHFFGADAIAGMNEGSGGGHAYGLLITVNDAATLHHSYFTRVSQRSPRSSSRGRVDIYNLYNYNTTPAYQFAGDGADHKINFTDSYTESGPYTVAQNKPYWAKFSKSNDPLFIIHIARCAGYRISGTSLDAMWAGQSSTAFDSDSSGEISEALIRRDTPTFTRPAALVHDVNDIRAFVRNAVGFSWVIDPDTGSLVDVRDSFHQLRIQESIEGTGPNDTLQRTDDIEGMLPTLAEFEPPGASYAEQSQWFLDNYFTPWADANAGHGITGTPENVVTINGYSYTEIELYLMSLIPLFVDTSFASPVTSSYRARDTFDLNDWSDPLRGYISDALQSFDDIHDSVPHDMYDDTLQQIADGGDLYNIGRDLNTQVTAAAHLLFLTGAPELVAPLQDLLDRVVDSATNDDHYGAPIHPLRQGSSAGLSESSTRLDDAMTCGTMAILVRVSYENGGNYQAGLDMLQAMWRRWQDGAWDGGGSITGDDPELNDRNFLHVFTNQARMAWHLWKITGNDNYKTGFDKYYNEIFNNMGTVQGTNRASWAHRPLGESLDTAQRLTYVRYTIPQVYEMHAEGAFDLYADWSVEDFLRGAHYYFLRDATTNGGIRQDATGACDSGCGASTVTINRYNGNGTRDISPENFEPREDPENWMQFFWPVAPVASGETLNYIEGQIGSTEYTRMMGGPLMLVLANWQEPE